MRSVFLATLALIWGSAIAIAGSAPEKLDLSDVPVINIDPRTDAGSGVFTLANHSSKSSLVFIHCGQAYATASGIPLPAARVALGEEGERPVKSFYKPETDLAPGDTLMLQIEASGITENGNYSIPLFNGPQPIGRLSVAGFPFRVHAAAPSNGIMPQVTISADRSFFTLKNDDPLWYPITWTLSIAGRQVTGVNLLPPSTAEDIEITNSQCGGTGVAPLCLLAPSGPWTAFTSLLKDSSQEAKLLISYRSPLKSEPSPVPHTQVPVSVATHFRSSEETAVIGSLVLFLILALGALLSVFTNLWIPHNLRKNATRTRLKLLIRSIREISGSIPSQARISVEVDARQILDRLQNAGWFYSDFESVLLYYEAQVSALEMRVSLLQQADECRQDLERLADMSVPPTYVTSAHEAFEPAMEVFEGAEWSSAQLKLATDLLARFKRQVDTLAMICSSGGVDDQFVSETSGRFVRMRAIFGGQRTGVAAEFEKVLPKIFKRLDNETLGNNLRVQDWVQIDFDLWKLRLIERYVNACDNAAGASWRRKLEEKAGLSSDASQGTLLYYLQLNTWDALRCAELLCNEIDQGIFPEDICGAVQHDPPQVAIRIRQKEIMAHRRVDCELCFSNYALNGATALREITPVWTFSVPDSNKPLEHAVVGDGSQHLLSSAKYLLNRAIGGSRIQSKSERGWVV